MRGTAAEGSGFGDFHAVQVDAGELPIDERPGQEVPLAVQRQPAVPFSSNLDQRRVAAGAVMRHRNPLSHIRIDDKGTRCFAQAKKAAPLPHRAQ